MTPVDVEIGPVARVSAEITPGNVKIGPVVPVKVVLFEISLDAVKKPARLQIVAHLEATDKSGAVRIPAGAGILLVSVLSDHVPPMLAPTYNPDQS